MGFLFPPDSDWKIMLSQKSHLRKLALILSYFICILLYPHSTWANEIKIRAAISERLPQLAKIDEVTKTAMGLYELRVGADIYYTDENGDYFFDGHMIDAKTRINLTQARIDKLTAINFSSLPLKDALIWKRGTGARKIAVFADPNCGYCKRFERDLQQVKDVTVYTFVYPILGPDSLEKSRNIWCAKDNTKAWLDWMLNNTVPPRSMAPCDMGALERNAALGSRYKVTGTPMVVFEDGKRVPGAMNLDQMETQLRASTAVPPETKIAPALLR